MRKYRSLLLITIFLIASPSAHALTSMYDHIVGPFIANKCPEFLSGDAQIEFTSTYDFWETGTHRYIGSCNLPIRKGKRIVGWRSKFPKRDCEDNPAECSGQGEDDGKSDAGAHNNNDDQKGNDPCTFKFGSIILPTSRAVGEEIPITGVPFKLDYFSNWASGNQTNYLMRFYHYDTNAAVTGYKVESTYAGGRTLDMSLANANTGEYVFYWDGRDVSNNVVTGAIPFDFDLVMLTNGKEVPFHYHTTLGSYKTNSLGFGLWSPSILHFYDTTKKRLNKGSGEIEYVDATTISGGNLMVAAGDVSEVYVFDSSGRHIYTKFPLTGQNKYEFEYDVYGKLVAIHQPNSQTTTFSYTGNNVTQITAPKGQITSLSYDGSDYLRAVTDPNGGVYVMAYNLKGLMTSFTKPEGQRNSFYYDTDGLLTLDYHSSGFFQNIYDDGDNFDSHARKKAIETKMGRRTEYTVGDGLQSAREISTKVDEPARSYTLRDQEFSFSKITPTYSDSHSFKKDPRFPDNGKYEGLSQLLIYGQPSAATYSNLTAVLGSTDPFDITSLSKTSTINGKTQTAVYSGTAKTWTMTSAEGRISTQKIDEFERLIETKVGTFLPTQFFYGDDGYLREIRRGDRSTRLFYDSNGYILSAINPLGQKISYLRDKNGNMLKQIFPDGRETKYTYDRNGNLASITPPSKPTHSFIFNAFEGIKDYLPPSLGGNSIKTSYQYNADKQLQRVMRPDGQNIQYKYDATRALLTEIDTPLGNYFFDYSSDLGLLKSVISPDGIETLVDYQGPLVSRSTQNYADSHLLMGIVNRKYDNEHRVSRLVIQDGTGATFSESISYDKDNLVARKGWMTYGRDEVGTIESAALGNSEVLYSRDGKYGELSRVDFYMWHRLQYSLQYERDKIGRITYESNDGSGNVVQYDSSGRFIGKAYRADGNFSEFYKYDENGNRVYSRDANGETTATYDSQDRILTWGSLLFSYNENGDLATKTDTATSEITTYSYDVFGNLKQVILPNSDVVSYGVDGMNRRVTIKLNGSLQKIFLYEDGLKIIAELDSSGAFAKKFIYESNSNVPDYMEYMNSRFIFVKDIRGSVLRVVNSSNGNVAQEMRYDSWGKVVEDTNPGFQPFGFAGGIYDSDTNLVRFGARDYDGVTGRWMLKDQIRFNGGSTNLYSYSSNDPINFVDSNGMCAVCLEGAELGAELGSIFGPAGAIAGAALGAAALALASKKLSDWQWKNLEDNTGQHPHDIKKDVPPGWDLYIEPDGKITIRPKKGQPGDPIETDFDKDDLKPGGRCEKK